MYKISFLSFSLMKITIFLCQNNKGFDKKYHPVAICDTFDCNTLMCNVKELERGAYFRAVNVRDSCEITFNDFFKLGYHIPYH